MTNVLENSKSYLDIQCFDGNNTVKCDMVSGSLVVTSVRLYAKSLNTYDGWKADAELIITHSGGGRHLYVCIPVISSEKVGLSSKWFSKVIPQAPSDKGSSVSINTNNLTLNDVIPTAAFTIYEGGTFEWGCGKDNVIILFHKNVAINMTGREYSTLTSVITNSSYALTDPGKNLQFNKIGTTAGPGRKTAGAAGKSMTCTPITYPDGTIIPPGENNKVSWSKPNGSMPDTGNSFQYILMYLGPILIFIAAVLVVLFLRIVFGRLYSWASKPSGSGENSSRSSESKSGQKSSDTQMQSV
jgi:hypothetical protein